jgi:hypothetical protein
MGGVGEHAHEEFVCRCSVGECCPFVREVAGPDFLECFRLRLTKYNLQFVHKCVPL